MDRQTTTLATLADAARLISGARSMDDVLHRVVHAAIQLTDARYGALGIVGEDGSHTRFLHSGFDDATVAAIGHLPRGEGVLGAVISRAETIRLVDLHDDETSVGFPAAHPPMHSFIGTPIRFDGSVFGNLYLAEKRHGDFTEEDGHQLEVLAALAGGAIEQAKLTAELSSQAIEAERSRLGRNLHDGVIQRLFSAGLTVEAARSLLRNDPDKADAHLAQVVDTLDSAVTDMRTTLVGLHAHEGIVHSLDESIRRLAQEYERTSFLFPLIDIPDDVDEELRPGVAADVTHLVRECLSNAARHASATNVELSIQREDGSLRLIVTDDGMGFDPDAVVHGHGLTNLHERAALHGGTVLIDAEPGRGTTVVVTLRDVDMGEAAG